MLLDTVSLFAAPSLSGGGEKKFLPMFTHVRNAHKTTETPECLTAVYPTIETVGGNPIGLVTTLPAVTGEGNLVRSRGGLVGNRAFFAGFVSSDLATDTPEFDLARSPRALCEPRRFYFRPQLVLKTFEI